jgi:hypothetical protein
MLTGTARGSREEESDAAPNRSDRQTTTVCPLGKNRLDCFLGSTHLLTLRRGRPPQGSGKPLVTREQKEKAQNE